ncbi:choline kinase [Mycoplasma haemofelis Ohio2]|uniref:Choline kinase n=1 Tax=Mycoplasma haemofelis (strain Ohio2) TaxID=859194 RepID=F6FHG5_MYCHI|nr:choline kinase [Mycoplasma haemofelis Ohio2]
MEAEELFIKALNRKDIKSVFRVYRGYSNRTYKLTTQDNEEFKVRIGDNNHFISRKNELAILKLTKNDNYLFYDEESGDSVWRWLDGDPTNRLDIDKQYLELLVSEIRKIHSSPFNCLVLLHDDLEFYEQTKDNFSKEDLDIYLKLVKQNENHKHTLCHNDISLGNLIYNKDKKSLSIIDFEWGRINSPYWDYGNFIKESDLDMWHIKHLATLADLSLSRLFKYCFMATMYSLQLSFVLEESESIKVYRNRLFSQLERYRFYVLKNIGDLGVRSH